MISVDISNIWGEVSLPGLLAIESEVAAAHEMLMEGTGAGNTFREWLNLPSREPNPEIFRILLAAERIRNDSDICVVVGIGGSCLGARAAMELIESDQLVSGGQLAPVYHRLSQAERERNEKLASEDK